MDFMMYSKYFISFYVVHHCKRNTLPFSCSILVFLHVQLDVFKYVQALALVFDGRLPYALQPASWCGRGYMFRDSVVPWCRPNACFFGLCWAAIIT